MTLVRPGGAGGGLPCCVDISMTFFGITWSNADTPIWIQYMANKDHFCGRTQQRSFVINIVESFSSYKNIVLVIVLFLVYRPRREWSAWSYHKSSTK